MADCFFPIVDARTATGNHGKGADGVLLFGRGGAVVIVAHNMSLPTSLC